jgi:hypothetical protein
MTAPTLRAPSVDAGVQSTSLLLMAAEGHLPAWMRRSSPTAAGNPAASTSTSTASDASSPAGTQILPVAARNIRQHQLPDRAAALRA